MSNKEIYKPAKSQKPVANIDWAELLSSEEIENLTGFFSVLIEMDLDNKKRNERGVSNEANTTNNIKSKQELS